jgi:choline dehydrogenase-like flavoprotein
MYNRGQRLDYDDWERLQNSGWSFKDLLPYFKKHENFADPSGYSSKNNIPLETTYDPNFHGTSGPIHTSFSTWRVPQEREWIAACTKLGKRMGSPKDGWSGDHIGTFHSLSSIDRSSGPANGTRSYAVTGYLLPHATRPNLHVLTDALVSKLLIDDASIHGVDFFYSGKPYSVRTKKEVVLSAGVFKTPQILELSGIGNPDILSKAGIKCQVENLRVGENLQDHPVVGIGLELVDGEQSMDALKDPAVAQKYLEEYATHRTGPFSSGGSATGFASYADLATPEEIKALQKLILESRDPANGGHTMEAKKLLTDGLASTEDATFQHLLLPANFHLAQGESQRALFAGDPIMEGKQGVTIALALARPLSVGSVHITSNNPLDDPAIDPAFLSHEADVELMAKGLELCVKITETSPFKEKIKRRYYPDQSWDLTDKEQRKRYAIENTGTEYHPLGSVSMGKSGVGAVDDRLRVWGTKGLRVIDASVIPLQVSGNIQSAVYAVAEKGSDLIKEDWGF